jgi:hypothetical protein
MPARRESIPTTGGDRNRTLAGLNPHLTCRLYHQVRCESTAAGALLLLQTRARARGDNGRDGNDELLGRIKGGVAGTRNRLALSCRETADNLSGYLEDDLPFSRRRRVARHLRGCIECRALLRSLAWTIEQLRGLGRSEAGSASVAETVVARIRGEAGERRS